MRGSLLRLIAIAVFVPTLTLMGISGYFLYKNFLKYEKVQKSVKYLELTKKLENMLVYLGQERGASSIYAVSKGKYPNSKKILEQKRMLFSNAINQLKTFVNQNPEFYNDVKPVLDLANQLPVIRKKIDSFKQNYIKTYFFNYYTVLESQIIKTIAKNYKYFPDEIKKTYEIKFPFERIISFTGIIRGFGSYYITADIPMSQKEYQNVLLKYYHDSNILPLSLLSPSIRAQFESAKFKKIEKDIKTVMFYIEQANMDYYINGTFNGYPIDAIDYFHLFTKRISFFKNAVNALNKQIDKELNVITTNATRNLIINAVIFIIAVILFLIGLYIERLIKAHINELSDLITSLAPITGKEIKVDIGSTKGINEAIKIVDDALKVIQESVKKSEEATKAKSLFLANMSHEIRTPLNGILGFLDLLKTTELTPEQEDYVKTIEQSAKNLLQIVNNILDVSKIESGKVTLEEIDFKAVDEFENTLEVFSTPCAQKNIQYVAEISPDIPMTLKGDVLKIKEILQNLLSNAIKFTPQNGLISVKINLEKVENNKASIYFEVKDTGIGMSEEQKEKVFEAFAQADESVTRKYGGTGLGLTIVKNYLELMGSKINVESAVNQGTRFYFTIDLEIVDDMPRYKKDAFSNITLAVLNTLRDSFRKEYSIEYLNYFGASRIGFNNLEELTKIKSSENINAIVVFYEESDKNEVQKLTKANMPVVYIASYAHKEEIEKLDPYAIVYDPNIPSKTYNTLALIKEQKRVSKERKKVTTEEKAAKQLGQLKALIAEDNPINMKLLQTTLKSFGIEADTAKNGLEAFNKYTMNPDKYDVIFMDVQMPIMDGVEATQEIIDFEKEEEIPHTPIIAVTANALKGDREKFIGAGMDDYISKPIKKEELLKILEDVARNKYSGGYEEKEETTTQIQSSNEPEETIIKPETTPTTSEEEKIIIATESSFLANYLHNVLDFDFETVSTIKELQSKLPKNAENILIIEEEFNGADVKPLITAIKNEAPKTKIIVISDKQINGADGIISDMNPENIKKVINELKGNK